MYGVYLVLIMLGRMINHNQVSSCSVLHSLLEVLRDSKALVNCS